MTKLSVDMYLWGERMKARAKDELHKLYGGENGEIGIRQIAITVGVILVVGAGATALSSNIGTKIDDLWDWLFEKVIKPIAE